MKQLLCVTLAILTLAACSTTPTQAQPATPRPFGFKRFEFERPANLRTRTMSSQLRARIQTTPLQQKSPPIVGKKTTSTRSGGFKPPVVALKNTFQGARTVDEFIDRLPDWQKANALQKDKLVKLKVEKDKEIKDGRQYNIERTEYSLTSTPQEIVTFSPVDGFFLGAIVQEQGLALGMGSLQEVPVPATKRAPFIISTNIPVANNFRKIVNPSATTTSSAIADLMQKNKNIEAAGKETMQIVDNYSEEQTALALGIDARYMMVSLNGAFKSNRYNSRHTVTASYIQNAFTATADFEGRDRADAFFGPKFTLADAKKLVEDEHIRPDNLPAYIKSITYGRVMIFNLTSTLSEKELSIVMGAAAQGGTYEVEVDAEFEEKVKKATFELSVTTIGGPKGAMKSFANKLDVDDVMTVMTDFLSIDAPLSTMVPISYSANTLRENKLAALSKTTEYTVTKYTANPLGERYKIKMWVEVLASDDGVGDNTFETYGSLMVSGDTWWQIPVAQAKANKVAKGQILKITEDVPHHVAGKTFLFDYFYKAKPQFKFNLLLRDWDKRSGDDTWFKLDHSLDLRAIADSPNKNTRRAFKNQHNGMGGMLFIEVERQDFL